MHHATLEGEQRFTRIAVILILLYSIVNILLRKLILQFKSNDRQSVDKNAHIKCQFACILRISYLACHAENVLFKHFTSLHVIFGRRQIEHNKIYRIHLDSVTKDINDTALDEFALQTVQKLTFFLFGFEYAQLVHLIWLCIL